MTDLYRDIIIDHYRNPRNFGSLSKPDRVYEQVNALCGDKIHIELTLLGGKKDPVIDNIRFTGEGCAISMATASMLTERLKGKPLSYLQRMGKDAIVKLINVELTPTRLTCALLPLEVIRKAVNNSYGR